MREIKVRGKRIDNKEFVYGYLIGRDVIVGEIVEFNDEYFNTEFWYKVDPETVGQYTGLCEMCDGDVLPPGAGRDENRIICYDTQQAKFKAVPISLFHANAGNGGWTGYELRSTDQVIGNRFDHPHLLGGDKG